MASVIESKFCFFGHFLNREFVRQKALNDDNEILITGESIEEILDSLWSSASHFIKREALVDGENFTWAENVKPTRPEIDKFVVLQDQGSKKTIPVTQRDRANADSTVSLMEMVAKLKGIHGIHYSAYHSSWVMWANYIQSAPANESRERLLNECPPAHLIQFRSVAFLDNERMLSARNGLHITDNMIDSFKGQLKLLREDFGAMRQSFLRAMEEVIESNQGLIAAMSNTIRPVENEVSQLKTLTI